MDGRNDGMTEGRTKGNPISPYATSLRRGTTRGTNINWFGTTNQISETKLFWNCQRNLFIFVCLFSWDDMHSNILKLWENCEEFWNVVICMLSHGSLPRWCMNPVSPEYRSPPQTYDASSNLMLMLCCIDQWQHTTIKDRRYSLTVLCV